MGDKRRETRLILTEDRRQSEDMRQKTGGRRQEAREKTHFCRSKYINVRAGTRRLHRAYLHLLPQVRLKPMDTAMMHRESVPRFVGQPEETATQGGPSNRMKATVLGSPLVAVYEGSGINLSTEVQNSPYTVVKLR